MAQSRHIRVELRNLPFDQRNQSAIRAQFCSERCRRRRYDASSTHLTMGNRANLRLLLCIIVQRDIRRPDLKHQPWLVTCLSPARRQGELLATQNPDGSLVFSAVLNDEQGLLSFLLVPPSAERTPHRQRHAGQDLPGS